METSDKVLFQGSEALEDEPLLEVWPINEQWTSVNRRTIKKLLQWKGTWPCLYSKLYNMYLNNKNININIDNPRTYFDVYELQEDWGIYLATKKRTMKLKCTEFDEEFSEDYAEGTTVRLQISKFDEIQYYSYSDFNG